MICFYILIIDAKLLVKIDEEIRLLSFSLFFKICCVDFVEIILLLLNTRMPRHPNQFFMSYYMEQFL
jgi:hypothetical protein